MNISNLIRAASRVRSTCPPFDHQCANNHHIPEEDPDGDLMVATWRAARAGLTAHKSATHSPTTPQPSALQQRLVLAVTQAHDKALMAPKETAE